MALLLIHWALGDVFVILSVNSEAILRINLMMAAIREAVTFFPAIAH